MTNEYQCTLCEQPLRGIIPTRVVPHGMPLDSPLAECLLFCRPECIRDWASKMLAFRDRDAIPTASSMADTEPRDIPLPTVPCGVWSRFGEWCLKVRGHQGKHRYPNLSECELADTCSLLADHSGKCT